MCTPVHAHVGLYTSPQKKCALYRITLIRKKDFGFNDKLTMCLKYFSDKCLPDMKAFNSMQHECSTKHVFLETLKCQGILGWL